MYAWNHTDVKNTKISLHVLKFVAILYVVKADLYL